MSQTELKRKFVLAFRLIGMSESGAPCATKCDFFGSEKERYTRPESLGSEAAYPSPAPSGSSDRRKFHATGSPPYDHGLPGCRAAIIRRSTGVRPFRHPDKPRPTATAR